MSMNTKEDHLQHVQAAFDNGEIKLQKQQRVPQKHHKTSPYDLALWTNMKVLSDEQTEKCMSLLWHFNGQF